MGSPVKRRIKRKICDPDESHQPKKARESSEEDVEMPVAQPQTAGKILKIHLRNIMCHESLEVEFNPNVNFIIGKNGSGKSAIITAIAVVFGARANITKRGDSLKALIKDNCEAASIEIVISNVGALAYKPELYGNTIKITRTFGRTSQYKLSNSHGKLISSKKRDLDSLATCMNIQIDNPISVLNQYQSATFLKDSNDSNRYELFMKATQLSTINDNYKSALIESQETTRILENTSKQMHQEKKEIEHLENNLRKLLSLDNIRAEYEAVQLELKWADAIAEEEALVLREGLVVKYENKVQQFENTHQDSGNKIQEINNNLEELNNKVKDIEAEAQSAREAYATAKVNYAAKKETVSNKDREIKNCLKQIQKHKADIVTYTNEIERLEGGSGQAEQKRNNQKNKVEKLKDKLAEIEALLNTNKTELSHLETTKMQYEQEERMIKMDADKKTSECNRIIGQLRNFEKSGGGNNSIYGRNIPRLKRRIDEEYNRGRFNKKPIGPIGEFIKLKDQSWIPAVENYLGHLSSFCVDNGQDSKTLGNIMREIYGNEQSPTILCSKFHNRVHDVSRKCARDQNYSNLLDMMEISNPVVANCIIDQKEPECLLLIPTSEEAKEMMGHARNVPRNCKRAITKKGDTFFPDPQYRTYGGKVGRARYLQVSTTDVIQSLQEELAVAERERNLAVDAYKIKHEELMRNNNNYTDLQKKIRELSVLKDRIVREINDLYEALQEDVSDNCAVFKADKIESERKLKIKEDESAKLMEEKIQLEAELKELALELRNCHANNSNRSEKITSIQQQIRELETERTQIKNSVNNTKQKIEKAQQELAGAIEDCNHQRSRTAEFVAAAQNAGDRVETKRSPPQLRNLAQSLVTRIQSVEQNLGSREELEQQLSIKRNKSKDIIELFNGLQKVNKKHMARVEQRREEFQKMKKVMARKVRHEFMNVLRLRNYDGSLIVDYANKKLKIEVIPRTREQQATNDVHTLSGGERSYSTIAFVLALWECTTLPFYFLDEIDVFMDKVNRRLAYDLLILHARDHPERQFGFLTPLDASIFKADQFIKILRLAPPARANDTQSQRSQLSQE
ncbi:structural maintenance of chromosomes protein 6 [Microplitis demolitor]|uniref:structural maintenance of chromosomes protein 6 n=1 Tax=Microplitis demolitor TaxID=69319 RepID=UPI0004CC99E8|nr:structural maintenance of chromosomes protein 6 [Microplitis demolitor]